MSATKASLAERFMSVIGLRPATNRDVLMCDLDDLDDTTFEFALLSRQSDLTERLNEYVCEDCKKQHDGGCVAPGDDDKCPFSSIDWLSWPCTRDHLIPEVTA